VLSNVEKGNERDGRRIVVGKSGEPVLGFLYIACILGIPAEIVAVKDRLTEPPIGPMTESESFNDFVIRVQTEKGELFLTVLDKFAPFGYLPAELRGQPGYRLIEGTPKVVTSTVGSFDGIVYEGTATMRDDGAAEIDLLERFVGKYGIAVRRSLETLPKAQLHDAVESKLLASDLPGASLLSMEVQDQDDLDKPLTIHMKAVMADFARRQTGGLALAPPFRVRVARMASLAERKTPMIIPDASHMEVRVRIKLPPRGTLLTQPSPAEVRDDDRVVTVRDRMEGKDLVLDRVFDLPAGRISVAKYPAFQSFARSADEATQREIRIGIQ
jgi:cellulose synthase operon protein C